MFAGMLGMTLFVMGSGCPGAVSINVEAGEAQTVVLGEQISITATITIEPADTTFAVAWTSSNPDFTLAGADTATVVVTAPAAAGETTLTVTVTAPADGGESRSDTVVVTAVGCDADEDCGEDLCDTATGLCVECLEDADCDDADLCTTDACTDGVCANTAVVCPEGETCNPETGVCESEATPCEGDADCDDGLFCNGIETCVEGFCAEGDAPCEEDETCEEGDDAAVCIPVTPETRNFTLGQDNLTGTSGNDIFSAPAALTGLGVQANTLQTGDAANGFAGDDVLNATLIGAIAAPTTIAVTLTGIEELNFSDYATGNFAWIIAGGQITGAEVINVVNSTHGALAAEKAADLTVQNLPSIVGVGVYNTTQDVNIGFASGATSGSADEIDVTVSNSTSAVLADRSTVTITTAAANGFETINVESTGAANAIRQIVQAGSATVKTMNITGDQNLQIGDAVAGAGALDNSITTVNAAGLTGNLVELTVGNGAVAFTGGPGNDTVIYGGNYTTADVINGGDGVDTLGLTNATANVAVAQTNVTNMEGVRILDPIGAILTLSYWGAISTVTADQGFNGGTAIFPLGTAGATVNVGANGASNDSAGNATIEIAGLGTTDALALNVNDSDFAGNLRFQGIETVNLASNDNLNGVAADGGANVVAGTTIFAPTFGTGTLNITGTAALTLTGNTTVGTIDANAFTKPLVMAGVSAIATTIIGGSDADQLRGGAGQDSISGGAGNDNISGEAGVDSLTTGTGQDTVQIRSATGAGVDRKIVADFTAGTAGDVINIDANDLGTLAGTNNFTTSAAIQTHSVVGNLTVVAATEVVHVTSGTVANFTEANSLNGTNLITAIGGTITCPGAGHIILVCVSDTSGNVGVYYGNTGANADLAAGEATLVAVLQNVTLGSLVYQNYTNVNGL